MFLYQEEVVHHLSQYLFYEHMKKIQDSFFDYIVNKMEEDIYPIERLLTVRKG